MPHYMGQDHMPGKMPMAENPTYEQLEKTIAKLKQELAARKNHEKSLTHCLNCFQVFYDSVPLGYQSLDKNGNLIEVNQVWLDILGYSDEEVLGKSLENFLHPDSKENFKKRSLCLKTTGGVSDIEFKLVKKDGSTILVSLHGKAEKDDQGRFKRTHCFLRDITKSRLDEQIHASRLRLVEFSADHSVDNLLQKCLDEAEMLTHSSIGFFHFLEPDQKTLSLQMWSSNTLEKMCTASVKVDHYPITRAGVWADCIRERRPVIHNDFKKPAHRKNMPEGHAEVVRELVVPVFRQNKITAVLGMGNKQTGYTEQDVDTAMALGDMAWDLVVRKQAEAALQKSVKKQEEKNTALNVLLENRDEERKKLVNSILSNFEKLVFPYYESIKNCRDKNDILTFLEIMETNTRETLSFIENTNTAANKGYRMFTPAEIQVADLVKAGKTSKDIATVLNISPRSVFFHRNNIRKKLHLHNTNTNLRTFLLSLA